MFIVELTTTSGKVCETYPTYEEARRRVELFPAEALAGIPFIFQELADGSQRLVREDGKPLQWHRLAEDEPPGPNEPVALCEEPSDVLGDGRWLPVARPETPEGEDEPPLSGA